MSESIRISVPGSTVSDASAATATDCVTRYGEPDGPHTVSALMLLDTVVGPGVVVTWTDRVGTTAAGG